MTNPIAILVMVTIVLLLGIIAVGSVSGEMDDHEVANDFDSIIEPIFETTAWLPLVLGGVVLLAIVSLIGAGGGRR